LSCLLARGEVASLSTHDPIFAYDFPSIGLVGDVFSSGTVSLELKQSVA
jgi:hypothetical protein